MSNPVSHSKFAKVISGKSVHFNRKGTYLVAYVQSSVTSPEMVISAFKDARDQLVESLIENHPNKAAKFKKCEFEVNMPFRMDAETNKMYYMDYSLVEISDYEVGKAICGFNYNGSMRKKIVNCEDRDIDLGVEIAKRFPDLEPLSPEDILETTKLYKGKINKITEAKTENVLLGISGCVEHPEKMKLLLDIIFTSARSENFSTNLFIYLINSLTESEIVKFGSTTDDFVVSILHTMLVENINKIAHDIKNNKVVRREAINLSRFFGELFESNAINVDIFKDVYDTIIEDLENSGSVEDDVMMNMINIINKCHGNVKRQCPEIFDKLTSFIDDFGETKHQFLLQNVKEAMSKIDDNDESVDNKAVITNCFKFVAMNPLCYLPAIKLPNRLTQVVKEYVKERQYTDPINLEYAAIQAHEAFVEGTPDGLKTNVIQSFNVPHWVSDDYVKKRLNKLSTSNDKSYPNIRIEKFDGGLTKRYICTFSPESDCYPDGPFAIKMLTKNILYNKEKTEHTFLTFKHARSRN